MSENRQLQLTESQLVPLFSRALADVREEVADNSYIQEALRVLPVGGYRSAIGSFWNAVVDDLRNKVIHRSLTLFNKSANVGRAINSYEDFQNHVTDDQLIDGAYKIGVIGWEAAKILRHAKETRHIFDGHPRSSEPSLIKVLAMLEDCTKYVLRQPYPPSIVDIDEYIEGMDSDEYDRNETAIANALGELPEVYKDPLVHRLLTSYVHPKASSVLRSNIEFAAPILWRVLPKPIKIAVVRRVDTIISEGSSPKTELAFDFVRLVDGNRYLSVTSRKYKIKPLVAELKEALDDWKTENRCVKELSLYAGQVPPELLADYVWAITHTYVGYTGSSSVYNRTDFYANGAAAYIPKMFEAFDDAAGEAFLETIKKSDKLHRRIETPVKLSRLRSLGNIVLSKVSDGFQDRTLLETLVNEQEEQAFWSVLRTAG